ncbi:hypothetical protein [Mycoplasmopsis edwardii]|uniref:Uncharacterized protein n=1 Tax=Mycoplasmopsis edwardii TaxID=53558 RepID=A0ACD4PGA3_9BACT|nr:hypothetical protein [Mycoplasmopsis edwardii]WBP83743.1 hypothetical protein Me_995_000362 [Mycoplasmopsis edwardii]
MQIIDSLGDDLNSADTRNALKAEINKATTTQDLDNLVPDDLKSKLEGYKTLIEGSDLSEAIKTELKGLLAKTTNNGTVESKDFANLDQEIFNKFKDKVNEYITNAPHLPDKDAEKQTINSLTLNGDLSAGLRDLKNRLNDLHKKNYSAQIENLPFPKTDPADKDPAVARIKAAYVDNLNYGDNYAATEEKLNKLQPLMTDIKTKINGINNQDVKDVLNNLLMNASTVEKLEELNDKMDKYKSIADKINSINDRNILTTDSSFRETSTAIEELKTSLYNELSSTNNLDAFDTKVDEVIKTVDNAKRTFSNSSQQEYEILMIKTIVDEVKTSNTDQITNLNQRIPRIREKMRRFWHGDRGDAIRRQKDDLFNVGSKTFNYDALVRKMRSTTNLDALEDLVTDEVDLYLDVIAHRIKEKATTGLPQDVQNSIREKLVAAPTKTERANISKYVGARAFENGNVARGFFDDARQQLAAIPESNRSAWQTRFNDLATSDNDSDVLRKIDDFNREARTFGNKLTPSRTKLNEYRRNYPNATETIQKLETLLNNASSISDLDNFDALLAKVNSISSSINGLPYPNPSSANANTSKTTLLNSILPNVNGQSNEQQLTTLKAVTATSLDPKVTEINSLSQSIQAEKDEINGLSAYSTNAQALTNFKNELDKATTIAQTNVVPADWNTNVNKYKNLISTKFANHNTNGEINNLNARLNQMIPNDLDANKLADNTNVTYGENNMKKEIADEYSGYINKKFNDSNLSNLTQDQRTQFTNDINSLKSDDKINSTTSFENFKTEVIDKMDEKLNDAMVTNFKNLVNSIPELSQTSKNNIIKNIVKPNEKNTIESRKQNVQTQLNNLSDKVSEIITEIEDISDFNKKQAFYFDLADVDTQAKADALYNKIRQYKTLDKTNAQRAIDAIDTAHRGNLQSRLDAATEQSVVNAIEQEALLTAAKVDAKKLVEAMTYPNWSTSVNNTAAPKSGVAKLNESIDQATSVDQVNNLKTTIKAVRAALDSTKSEINLLTYDYDKNELNNELFAASTVAEMNTTKGKVLKKVKTEVNNRVEQQLRRAAQLMRPSDDTSKTMTRSEELYLEEFKRQVNSKTLVSDVRTKELDFLYGRFVDATRMRAIVLSIHNYFSGSYRFGGDKERADWDKKSPLLRNYVSNYNYKRGFNDSADSRTLFNFVKEYSYEAIPTAALRNTKYDWDVRKSWNLSAQFGISVQYEHGSDDNSIRSKISSSIITKAIEKVRANADWSIDKKYDLIYKLTSIVSDNSGNVYNKLVNLKTSDPDLGPLLQGNGNYGFDRSGHVYQDSLSEGNYRS